MQADWSRASGGARLGPGVAEMISIVVGTRSVAQVGVKRRMCHRHAQRERERGRKGVSYAAGNWQREKRKTEKRRTPRGLGDVCRRPNGCVPLGDVCRRLGDV